MAANEAFGRFELVILITLRSETYSISTDVVPLRDRTREVKGTGDDFAMVTSQLKVPYVVSSDLVVRRTRVV